MKPLSSPQKEQAAQLIAEGRHEYGEIAEKVMVDRVTLHRWRKDPKFIARVEEISNDIADRMLKYAIARKEYRVASLNALQTKLETLIEQRAEALADVSAGGDTGLLVKQFKVSGENVVTEYAFDAAVVRELRAVKEQVAKELGQIVDKRELTGKDGGPIQHEHSVEHMTNEQIEAELAKTFGALIATRSAESAGEGESRSPVEGAQSPS
jgi:hypothetical protein